MHNKDHLKRFENPLALVYYSHILKFPTHAKQAAGKLVVVFNVQVAVSRGVINKAPFVECSCFMEAILLVGLMSDWKKVE